MRAKLPNIFHRIVCYEWYLQWELMTARVYVSIKPTVLDPQGQTIHAALMGLGHRPITSVRQGKYFEIGLAEGTTPEEAAKLLDGIAHEVLSNPGHRELPG